MANIAVTLRDAGNHSLALKYFTFAISSYQSVRALHQRALLRLQYREYQEALEDLEEINRMNPFHLPSIQDKIVVLFQLGRTEEALKEKKRCLELIRKKPTK